MKKNETWGQIVIINLYDCPKENLTDKMKLKKFAKLICNEINMKPHWNPMVDRFWTWDLEGYSMLQFIETSSITVHLDEFWNRAFIDIFSCREFDWLKATNFSKKYFGFFNLNFDVINAPKTKKNMYINDNEK